MERITFFHKLWTYIWNLNFVFLILSLFTDTNIRILMNLICFPFTVSVFLYELIILFPALIKIKIIKNKIEKLLREKEKLIINKTKFILKNINIFNIDVISLFKQKFSTFKSNENNNFKRKMEESIIYTYKTIFEKQPVYEIIENEDNGRYDSWHYGNLGHNTNEKQWTIVGYKETPVQVIDKVDEEATRLNQEKIKVKHGVEFENQCLIWDSFITSIEQLKDRPLSEILKFLYDQKKNDKFIILFPYIDEIINTVFEELLGKRIEIDTHTLHDLTQQLLDSHKIMSPVSQAA